MKSGKLNFLEPPGSPQACNGTALPLLNQPIIFKIFFVITVVFRNHNPSMQGVLYFVPHAQTAAIPSGT